MSALLLISLIALLLTKLADIATTVRCIRRAGGSVVGERNPFARWAMRRWGLGGGIALVMVLWVLVVAVCYVPAWFAPVWYQAAVAAGGFLFAWAQADVARMNATGRHSRLTAWLMRGFSRLGCRNRAP